LAAAAAAARGGEGREPWAGTGKAMPMLAAEFGFEIRVAHCRRSTTGASSSSSVSAAIFAFRYKKYKP
jgi:hypothetical protein